MVGDALGYGERTVKLLVCGGRSYSDAVKIRHVLDRYLEEYGDDLIVIHGACPTGADKIADRWCIENEVDCVRVHAKWNRHGKRAAGPIRNKRMRDKYRPDAAVAAPTPDHENAGTWGMVALLREVGIEPEIIE